MNKEKAEDITKTIALIATLEAMIVWNVAEGQTQQMENNREISEKAKALLVEVLMREEETK